MLKQSSKIVREGVDVLGIPVSTLCMDETVRVLTALLEGDRSEIVVTADASGLAMAQDDPELAEIYQAAALATADSMGVVWALKRKGVSADRVSGVDLMDRLCHESAVKGFRVYLLGAAPGVAIEAGERMKLRHPGCNIVGCRDGYFPAADDGLVAEEVAESHPDLLLVAMGIPRQEKFIAATRAMIRAKVAIGVG